MNSFFRINLREEPLLAFRLQVVQNVNSYKVDKNAESAKMSHEALTTSVMRVTIPSLTAKEAESPENTGFQPLFTHQKCSYILLLFSFLTGFLDA